jgi:hypothetical protein
VTWDYRTGQPIAWDFRAGRYALAGSDAGRGSGGVVTDIGTYSDRFALAAPPAQAAGAAAPAIPLASSFPRSTLVLSTDGTDRSNLRWSALGLGLLVFALGAGAGYLAWGRRRR